MLFANNANTTLASSLTNSATTMSVVSASAFPSPTGSQYFYCTLADAATQTTIEIVKVTAVSGTTFTIVRGQDGTSGTAFSSGAVVSLRLVRASLNDFPKLDEDNTFTGSNAYGTPASITLTNGTGLPIVGGTTGTLTVARGGTGLTSLTANYIPYGNGTGALSSSSTLTFASSILNAPSFSATSFYYKQVGAAGSSGTPAGEIALQYQYTTTPLAAVKFWNILQNTSRSWASISCTNDSATQADYFWVTPYNGIYVAGNLYPNSDNVNTCGQPSNRWTVVYATTALINTSDAKTKTVIGLLNSAEQAVAKAIKGLIKTYKLNSSIKEKGIDNARIHVGVVAQDVQNAFAEQGLNADNYGLFCSDTWYEIDGKTISPAGDAYKETDEGAIAVTQLGVRYEELLAFVIAAL